jgi:Family of unknown function (DUF6308)
MALQPPAALNKDDDAPALKLLRDYYRKPFGYGPFYTGSAFDTWDSTGTRSQDVNVFTADDLVAVTFLSVRVGPLAAHVLLDERRSDFSEILEMIGPDHDLVDEATIPSDWPAWELDRELTCLPDVGPTIASKLIARKRPRLMPIYDSVVSKVLGTKKHHWEPIRVALRKDDHALHNRLLRLKEKADLPEEVSVLRVLDVIAWMEGTHPDPGSVA